MEGTQGSDKNPKRDQQRDLREELVRLENMIEDLRIRYEQHFLGIITRPPTKQHDDLKRFIRQLLRSPFRSSAVNFKLKTLESRYQTYNNYWQRTLREREEGRYHRDVFKADLHEKLRAEEAQQKTGSGAAERGLRDLFNTYRSALEQQTGKAQNVNFERFTKKLVQRSKDLKKQHGGKKVTFKVEVDNGKVKVRAKTVG